MNKRLSEILKHRLGWFMIPLLTIAFAPAYGQDGEEGEIMVLSPFSIVEDTDEGYLGRETLAGTRVKADVRDLGASITLLTDEFMDDIAANDLMEILPYVGQTEVGGIFGNFSGEGNTNFFGQNRPTTFLRQHPQTQTRIRGLDAADLTRDYSLTDLPLDGYIVDRVAIQRGANSMLFGLGSPAGLINSQIITAQMDKDQFKGEFRTDNYGTIRATIDVNKIIFEDKLAVRVASLYEDQEYVQEPTFEEDRRIFGTVTYKPFQYTTIKGSFEAGRIKSSRPDIMAPVNGMSQNWFDAGMPVGTWDLYEKDKQPPHPMATGPFWGHIHAPYEVYASSKAAPNSQFNGVGLMQRRQKSRIECWTERANQANPNADGTLPGLPVTGTRGTSCYELNADGTKATNAAGKFIPIVDPVGPVMFFTSGFFHPQNIGGGKQGNDTASTFCDVNATNGGTLCHSRSQEETFSLDDINWVHYDKYKFHSPEAGEESFTAFDVAFQQLFFTDRDNMSGGFEFVWHVEDYNSNFFDGQWDGLISGMFVDINPVLFDGRDNPNFMRPAVANFRPENQHNAWERQSKRFTANFSFDLTNHEGFLRHLGRHSITALYNDQYNHYFHGEGFTRPIPAPVNNDERDSWFASIGSNVFQLGGEHGYICYVGPPIAKGTPRNQVVINDTCPASALPRRGETFKVTVWDRFAASENKHGQTFTEVNGQVTAWRHRKVNVALENAESIVFINHSHWLDDHLVSTLGWRQDEVFLENFPGNKDTFALHKQDSWSTTSPAGNAKTTIFSWGLVGHLPSAHLPDGVGLRGHISSSENFVPAAGRTNAEGMPQPAPGGTTDEYGFSFDVLQNNVTVKLNWYESAMANSAVSTAIGHNENFGSSLIFGPAIGWLSEAGKQFDDGDPYGIVAAMEATALAIVGTASPTHQKAWSWSRPTRFDSSEGDPANTVQVADTVSKGFELEILGSPIKGLNLGINLSKQQVIQTNIAKSFIALFERERPELEAISIASQNGFTYNSAAYGLPTPAEYVRIESEMHAINAGSTAAAPVQEVGYQESINSLASRVEQVKRTDGQVSLEVREWRFNVFANYAFQGDGFLKGFGVGGAMRWQDEVALDYQSEIFTDSTGRELLVANLDSPIKDSPQTQADVWINYRRNIFDMDWTFRLNVRNAIRGDAAVAAIGQPDNPLTKVAMYRIVQPTTYIFSASFAF